MRSKIQIPCLLILLFSLAGCSVGPHYTRPATNTPPAYRGAENTQLPPSPSTSVSPADSLGNQNWAEVFRDPVLQALIREALANNYDVKIAAEHVLEQQDQVGITRAQEFPTVSGGAAYTAIGLPSSLASSLNSSSHSSSNYYAGGFTLSAAWNLDFWGLYRHQTEAARAQLLATEWGRRLAISTVVENVATAYLHLQTLDAALNITRQTIDARQQSLKLTKTLETGGAASLADVRQAEQLLYSAQAALPDFQRQIQQQENSISILLGRNPGPILRGGPVTSWPPPEPIPAGLPSQLLERRPDIQQAEAALVAANANLGAARAQLFPQLALSGTGGTSSNHLEGLFNGSNIYWYATGNLTQIIFDGGRLRNNVKLTEAQKQEQILAYQRTVKQAFQSVSDALIALEKFREYRQQEEKYTFAAQAATQLARTRYQGGAASYLEVLTNDSNYYSAQLALASAREQEALSLIQLYSALGGGWRQ